MTAIEWTSRTESVRSHVVDADGRPVCEVCLKPVRPDEEGTFSLIVGFVQARAGGGAHGVSDRRDLGVYRHKGCHRYGTAQGVQESLL
jgi:hypothetical protein